jgi:hypothetical protein
MDNSYDLARGLHHNHLDLHQALLDLAKHVHAHVQANPDVKPFEEHVHIDSAHTVVDNVSRGD